MSYAKSAITKFTMVRNPEIKLLESRVRRKPQARFGEGYSEKEHSCYLAGYLLYTSDGRKLGLDPRLIDPSFEDNPQTKLNQCVENVARIHAETAEDKLTQIIFCDLGVPHKSSAEAEVEGEDADDAKDKKSIAEVESLEEECEFCVYDDIRDKLIAKGIPAEEIAYIHDAKIEKQKSELFEKVRSGEVRVLLGSTAKMGTGTNVQKKLIAVHDLDIPWRSADLDQRAGRIIRQGNENKNV